MSKKIEVEGGELVLQSEEGHYAIIPSKDRSKLLKLVKDECDDCINSYIKSLPLNKDYAEDGTIITEKDPPEKRNLFDPMDVPFKTEVSESTSNASLDISKRINDFNVKRNIVSEETAENPRQEVKSQNLLKKYEENNNKKIEFKTSTSGEVEKLQTELTKKGYNVGKTGADGKLGKNTIKAFQNMLKDNGKDLGTFGKNKDGIDGIMGPQTKAAYENYKSNGDSPDLSSETKKAKCDKEGCAEYVSGVLKNKVLGDAWEMKSNIEKDGKKIKYNIYDDPRFKNVKSAEDLKKATVEVKKGSKAVASMFKVGDVVGLYNSSSDMHKTALTKGKGGTYNTHVGTVTDVIDGVPIISHNIHGKLYHQPYNKLTIGWIGESGAGSKNVFNDKSNTSESIEEHIDYYSTNFIKDLGVDVDVEQVKNDIYGITGVESGFGKNKPNEEDISDSMFNRGLLGKKSSRGDISQGATKFKSNSLNAEENEFLNVNANNIGNDKENIKAATYKYVKNYATFSEYAKSNPQLNLNKEDIRLMTILSHNQGTAKLLNLGYNNPSMDFKEELATLRQLRSGKISDISSTKFKHLETVFGKVGLKDLGIIVGNTLYDMKFPGGHKTYVNRVLDHGKKK